MNSTEQRIAELESRVNDLDEQMRHQVQTVGQLLKDCEQLRDKIAAAPSRHGKNDAT